MALKTWAPYDRLTAEDLNGAHQYLAGSGLMVPGAVCRVAGPKLSPAVNNAVELKLGAPAAGQDPLGYYVAATGRLKIPVGLAGLYAVTYAPMGTAPAGTASSAGANTQCFLNGALGVASSEAVGSWFRFDSPTVQGLIFTVIRTMADAEEWWVTATPRVAAGTDFYMGSWSIARLGQGIGAIGS